MKRARADLEATQSAIYETALPLYKKYFPERRREIARGQTQSHARRFSNKLAEQHPDDITIVGYGTESSERRRPTFVKEHDLVTVPATPIDVIVMPEFKRGPAIAYCDSPGPLEENGKTFFAIAPTPNDWPKERKRFVLPRIQQLHDARPDRARSDAGPLFAAGAHANQFHAPTLVRAIFQSGSFVEGWAVYTEQVMAEARLRRAGSEDAAVENAAARRSATPSSTKAFTLANMIGEGSARPDG